MYDLEALRVTESAKPAWMLGPVTEPVHREVSRRIEILRITAKTNGFMAGIIHLHSYDLQIINPAFWPHC